MPSGESVRRDTRSGEDEKHMKTESIKKCGALDADSSYLSVSMLFCRFGKRYN